MTGTKQVEWSRTAVADGRTLLSDTEDRRGLCEGILLALRKACARAAVHDVPPEFLDVGLTHIREVRAGDIRIFYRLGRSRLGVIGLLHVRHDPGEALFRRMLRDLA
jgi:plasmid stabilization system protein ParE